ncbi:hypothetical protein bcere0002_55990 [Bacillus cereus ATCC 10876]|nr:hypothetical protein BCAH1134_0955 [Bacillus cereus AH1134]EEK47420.1 hypothetical protein bcere0002_55990 [Bacillus cereus ATCC 10876]KZD50663.1 hypothetical protein B4084_1299 [Bacillus cereus]KZD68452.1 hypothetical protein B4118_1265 [Bacillus cereus]
MNGSPIHILRIKVIQIGGRNLWGAFLFMEFIRKYLKYNTVDYIIMCV